MKLPVDLPHPASVKKTMLRGEWPEDWTDKIEAEFRRAQQASGWNPKALSFTHGGEKWRLISLWGEGQNSNRAGGIQVMLDADHPFLSSLPANAPRAVKHLYRKETLLRYAKMAEAWSIEEDMTRADFAWLGYRIKTATMERKAKGNTSVRVKKHA
jgi:hypothetical protein